MGSDLTVEEVARWARVDAQTVRRWIRSGKLRARKPGRDYLIPTTSLAAFEAQHTLTQTTTGSP